MSDRWDAMSPRERGGKTYWTRIGTMFPSKSGDGFNLVLDALPLPDKEGQVRISMFPPRDRDEAPSRGQSNNRQPARQEPDLDGDSVPFW